MALGITSSRAKAAVVVALVVVAAVAYWAWPSGVRPKAEIGATASANRAERRRAAIGTASICRIPSSLR